MAVRLCQAASRHGSMGTSTPTNFRRPAPHRRKKNPVTTVTGFFLAGDEGFEPPQTESESGVLPLHKSPIPSPLKRHLLLYAKIAVCQGLFLFGAGIFPAPQRVRTLNRSRWSQSTSCGQFRSSKTAWFRSFPRRRPPAASCLPRQPWPP